MKLPSAGRAAQPAQPARVPLRPDLAADPIADPPNPVSAWNVANALTVFRLVLVPVFLVVLFVRIWLAGGITGLLRRRA